MVALQELINIGIHDAKVYKLALNFNEKSLLLYLSVCYEETQESSSNGYDFVYKNCLVTFNEVLEYNIDGEYDFKNEIVILEGKIDDLGCNIYLSSDQRIIIKSKQVRFSWV